MISPPALQKGDAVGILSTARKISPEELQPALKILENWGLEPITSPNLFKEENQFAGSDHDRLSDFQSFVDDPGIKAILCARGGYGTVRIIDNLNFDALQKNPKWICGYSDVTVLHNKLSRLGIESLHSSMPVNFGQNTDLALDSLCKALFGEALSYTFEAHPFNRKGSAKGLLTGGNLSMLYSQTGSPTSLHTQGKLLFIEDLDEYLYHIDRMMYNLRRNAYFESLAGVVVGSLSDMNDNAVPFGHSAEEIVRNHLAEYEFPVCYGFPAGHLTDNRTLIMGRKAYLEVAEKCTLNFDG